MNSSATFTNRSLQTATRVVPNSVAALRRPVTSLTTLNTYFFHSRPSMQPPNFRKGLFHVSFGGFVGVVMERKDYFPIYEDGDVKVVITGARQYQLHHSTLTRTSPKLASLLTEQYEGKLCKEAIEKGVVMRYRLDAVEALPRDDYHVKVILQPSYLDCMGEISEYDGIPIGLDLENGLIVDPIYSAYDVVLGAFYGRDIDLGEFDNNGLTDILEKAIPVLNVAEYLEVVHLINKPIEAALLASGQVIQCSIFADPASWLEFAYRIRSGAIFREALIHAVGQYNTKLMQDTMKEGMRPEIAALIKTKAETLLDGIKTAQLKILSYYPTQLQRQSTVGLVDKDHIGRASYSNDIFSWIALTAFRHWVGQKVANDQTHHGEDMGFEVMWKLSKAGDFYLGKPDLAEFHRYFPMSGKGAAVMENKLSHIKDHVKRFVTALMKNNSQLDLGLANCQYFTCTRVEYSDYPWTGIAVQMRTAEEDIETEEERGEWELDSEIEDQLP